jgi:hypothetical protein
MHQQNRGCGAQNSYTKTQMAEMGMWEITITQSRELVL